MTKIAITMATLESHNHIVGDIERGVNIFNQGNVEWDEREPGQFLARVPHKSDFKMVTITFDQSGQDIAQHFCHCTWRDKEPPVCRHVVAAVLSIQGGVIPSTIVLGKTTSVNTTVTDHNTAKAIGSGSLDVFATPMMIAQMERAACDCLSDGLESGQTSVGTHIDVSHTAASLLGAEVTATATIEYVFGRRIEFKVTAHDGAGVIGSGKHTRVIIDAERFMRKVAQKT